jgi:uracil phosphoribosyltransferase
VLPGARLALLAPAAGGEGWALDTLPAAIGERVGVLVYVPVVASGRTLLAVLERLRTLGVQGPRLRVITSVAAAPGLKLIGEQIPDLTLYCSCIDAELDGEGRLLPGFGDPERRLHGIEAAGCLG